MRTFKSGLLNDATTLEIVARSETQRGVVLNGEGYWITKTSPTCYTVAKEGGKTYVVTADDLGGRCGCDGNRFHKHRVCRHTVAIAVLRQDARSLSALAVKEVV